MKKIINLVLVIFIITTLASFSFACSKQENANEESKAAGEQAEETTAAEATEAAEETTAAETVAEAAGECPAATSVQLESTNGAYVDRMPISWDSIGTQSAYLSHSTNNTAVFIYIANFETGENLKDVSLTDGQAVIYFTARVRGEGDPVPVSLGIYSLTDYDNNDLHVSANIRVSGGSTVQISTDDLAKSDFEITSVTDSEICGKFDIENKWTKMSGEFKVPVVK